MTGTHNTQPIKLAIKSSYGGQIKDSHKVSLPQEQEKSNIDYIIDTFLIRKRKM